MFNFDPVQMLMTMPGIVIGLAFHEFAHAFTADRLGDPTPRSQGRLTLSPLPHIDWLGFILIMLLGFGWAKPVQINSKYLKNPRRDDILISLSGPFANVLVAVLFIILLKFFLLSSGSFGLSQNLFENFANIFLYAIYINFMLAIFNLIPIPPLDGFHVLANMIPMRSYAIIETLYRYSSVILILLIATGMTSRILTPVLGFLMNFVYAFLRA